MQPVPTAPLRKQRVVMDAQLSQPLRAPEERDNEISGPSQLSCVQCRNRKLKCDRSQPSCGRCAKQNEACNYPGSRQRGLGPRKTVQELEGRIEELEKLLRNANLNAMFGAEPTLSQQSEPLSGVRNLDLGPGPPQEDLPFEQVPMNAEVHAAQGPANQLIGLGLFEQLPSFDIIDELTALYFQTVHAGAPMLHQASYTVSLRLPPHMRPPMCLQYIVMAAAAATSETYRHLSEAYYQRARVYAEADELKGQGETFTTVGHVQSWCLISAYECHVFAMFTRASTSLCRGVRIAQMLKLHQLDMQQPDQVHVGLPPPRTTIEAEERRRTWWVVFLADRYLTSTTGWPSLIDERHIRTHLPASEESFSAGFEDTPTHLSQALRALEEGRGSELSPLAVRILAANELLHTLDHSSHHLGAGAPSDAQETAYWQRHRELDANLTTLTFFLPERLRLSHHSRSLDAILVHVCTNMATMQLHRAALGQMMRRARDPRLIAQSQARLLPAADNIVAVFRAAGDRVGTAIRNPILSFAAYMAASIFLENYLQAATFQGGSTGPSSVAAAAAAATQSRARQSKDNLDFLAQNLIFFGKNSALVRANALQLAADMQRTGYDSSMLDAVMDQLADSGGGGGGGSASWQILVPGSRSLPMFFCPALTTTIDKPLDFQIGTSGASGAYGGNDDLVMFPDAGFAPWPSATSHAATSSILHAGSSSGLFSQFEGGPGLSYSGI